MKVRLIASVPIWNGATKKPRNAVDSGHRRHDRPRGHDFGSVAELSKVNCGTWENITVRTDRDGGMLSNPLNSEDTQTSE